MSKPEAQQVTYGEAICCGFDYLLGNYPEVFVIGQGLWSPWYVGNSMTGLEKKYGTHRIIDTPVSEAACTGAAVGASLCGMKAVVVHPRMDFMLYAMDPIVNQASKWSYMFGGQAHSSVTFRAIINRGGEQGAQHSQALHAWFAHIPGLRVVMPSTVEDARDLLIASVLCKDPVMYIDDRWLYDQEEVLGPVKEIDLRDIEPAIARRGKDVTLTASGYSVKLALEASVVLNNKGIECEVIDIRVLNPFDSNKITDSVRKTGRLVAIDGGWKTCGCSAEIIASATESLNPSEWKTSPKRVTLADSPAPTSHILEAAYYPSVHDIIGAVMSMFPSV